jgi:hypothetical protein
LDLDAVEFLDREGARDEYRLGDRVLPREKARRPMFRSKASRIRSLEAQLHAERQARRDLIAAMNVLRHKLDLARAGESRDAPDPTARFRESLRLPQELHHRN